MLDEPVFETCTCGRYLVKPHCPHCGCYTVQAFAKQETVNRGGGRLEHIRAYRCRGCAAIFNDDERKKCKAPPAMVTGKLIGKSTGHGPRFSAKAAAVVFKTLDEAPPVLAERVEQIKKLKDEGKW